MKWVLIVTLLTKPEPLEVVFESPAQCVQAMVRHDAWWNNPTYKDQIKEVECRLRTSI
jgi:hypothetical protein